jgi:hypothetical protein
MDSPESFLGNATSPALGPPLPIIGADGPDQTMHTLDVDEASFTAALRNASTVTRSLSTKPRRVMA